MLCPNCAKLAFMPFTKKCIKCQLNINLNLYVLCDNCSNSNKQCCVCLKKIQPVNSRYKGCHCRKMKV